MSHHFNQPNYPGEPLQSKTGWEGLENNLESNDGISERSHEMVIASLRGVIERRNQAIADGKQPAMSDNYYKIVEERLKKYDAKHNRDIAQ